jgi:formylmethanofuran dehydrogenase subunit E
MDESPDPPAEAPVVTVQCGMCKRRVPTEQTRVMSGRLLCFGCLASWYDDDEEDK